MDVGQGLRDELCIMTENGGSGGNVTDFYLADVQFISLEGLLSIFTETYRGLP
jgi:hypothetical protein